MIIKKVNATLQQGRARLSAESGVTRALGHIIGVPSTRPRSSERGKSASRPRTTMGQETFNKAALV